MKHPLNFEDTGTAFSLRSTKELKRAGFLFTVIGNRRLTLLARPLTNFLLWIKFPLAPILKKTVFKQFCGGESITECEPLISEMFTKSGVCSILDYSVEGQRNEAQFDQTLQVILRTYDFAKNTGSTPFLVFKATGLGRFALFEKVSRKESLTAQEQGEWNRIVSRVDKICRQCHLGPHIRVMIDAEESWIQNAIDGLAEEMMSRYNGKRAVVFNTVQMYRHDRLEYLHYLCDKGVKENHQIGVKLVRGAYMEKEMERARSGGYLNPICGSKHATDKNFDDGLRYCSQNIPVFEIFLGTHNELSVLLLTEVMAQTGLQNNDHRIWFGQLYGMSDHISFNLAAQNYNTAKYLPFGPVKEVIPYLFRRAEENTSVGVQTSRELYLIKKEITRREQLLYSSVTDKIFG
jgi:proline dehydrogenase